MNSPIIKKWNTLTLKSDETLAEEEFTQKKFLDKQDKIINWIKDFKIN